MSGKSDFVIENGVLKKYKGPGGDVTIPEGVTEIGDDAFSSCINLKTMALPMSIEDFWGGIFQKTVKRKPCFAQQLEEESTRERMTAKDLAGSGCSRTQRHSRTFARST